MRAGGAEVQLPSLLPSASDGRDWSTSRPGHFTSRGKNPRLLLNKKQSLPCSRSGRSGKEKNHDPDGYLTLDRAVRSLVTILTTLSRLHDNIRAVTSACVHQNARRGIKAEFRTYSESTFKSRWLTIPLLTHSIKILHQYAFCHTPPGRRNVDRPRKRRSDQ